MSYAPSIFHSLQKPLRVVIFIFVNFSILFVILFSQSLEILRGKNLILIWDVAPATPAWFCRCVSLETKTSLPFEIVNSIGILYCGCMNFCWQSNISNLSGNVCKALWRSESSGLRCSLVSIYVGPPRLWRLSDKPRNKGKCPLDFFIDRTV